MGLMNVLACFMIACIVMGSTRGQSITVDKANLCSTYQYRVHWNGWTSGQYIQATSSLIVGTVFFTFTPTTAEGYADWYLLPSASATYTVRLIGNDSLVVASDAFTADPCQNLRTFGLAPELQAIVVLNHFRANNSLSPVFYNSLLETVAGLIATGNTTELSTAFALAGKSYDGNAVSIASQGTAFFDAGSLLQSLLMSNKQNLVGQMNEVGFGYSQTHESWVLIAGTRNTVVCGDRFVAGSEQCDDGNRDPNDGCASDCTVENGFTCSVDILQEGSVCSRTPVDTPSAQTGPNTPSQSSTPSAQNPSQNRGSVTKEAGTLALLLALIAVVLSF